MGGMFGQMGRVTGVLRKIRSKEPDHLYSSPNTVLMIKQGRMRWLGMDNTGKGKAVTGPQWPRVFQEVKVPRFRDNGPGWW